MEDLQSLQEQIKALQDCKYNLIQSIKDVDTTTMSKQELKNFAMTLPPIREDLWSDMNEYGFQTGSSVMGADNPADIDWVCHIPASAFTYSCCAVPCGKVTQDYIDDARTEFIPLYANKDGQLYNIICIGNPDMFEAWKQTTNLMTALTQTSSIVQAAVKTKWKRVRLFRALCDIFQEVKPGNSYLSEIPYTDALKYEICRVCGREAINFTCKPHKDEYKQTGICERCQSV